MKGSVFDIKEFTVHDGPGARVTVFLKGCPLRCVWCHNPEGLSQAPELLYRNTLCTDCGACKTDCDHLQCKPFGRCVRACPNGCLQILGQPITAEALADGLRPYTDILTAMGGGITFSGGEPLLQTDFLCEVMALLPGVHFAVQTSGYAPEDVYRKLISPVDYVLQDIKLADPAAHKKFTGADNRQILRNIEWLKQSGKPFVFRVPLIPDITDTAQNLRAISLICGDYPVELMPYNPMAGAKYPMVGKTYSLPEIHNAHTDYTGYFANSIML